ncbi:MAG: hypothetical protein F6K41_28585 [Symploca sp. SIO3E6]|nr:hypothetical protein [Caldora sp. SIO3E6]
MTKGLIGLMGLLLTVGLATNASTSEKTDSEQRETKGDSQAVVMPFGFAPSWSDNLGEGVGEDKQELVNESAEARHTRLEDTENGNPTQNFVHPEEVASFPELAKMEEYPEEQIPQEEIEAITTKLNEVIDVPAQEEAVVPAQEEAVVPAQEEAVVPVQKEAVVNQEPAPEIATEELEAKPNSQIQELLDTEIEQAAIQEPSLQGPAPHKPSLRKTSLPNGTYLYGQSSQPEKIGREYLVFEANQGEVVGALYMPSSEFSCFQGTLDSNHLNLKVVNPYDQTAISHIIARAKPSPIAAAGGQLNLESSYDSLTYPHAVGLEGYQQISEVSDNDHRILSLCRNNDQGQI